MRGSGSDTNSFAFGITLMFGVMASHLVVLARLFPEKVLENVEKLLPNELDRISVAVAAAANGERLTGDKL